MMFLIRGFCCWKNVRWCYELTKRCIRLSIISLARSSHLKTLLHIYLLTNILKSVYVFLFLMCELDTWNIWLERMALKNIWLCQFRLDIIHFSCSFYLLQYRAWDTSVCSTTCLPLLSLVLDSFILMCLGEDNFWLKFWSYLLSSQKLWKSLSRFESPQLILF